MGQARILASQVGFLSSFSVHQQPDSSCRPHAQLGECSSDTDMLLTRLCRVISHACASLAVLIVGILLSVNN